VEGPRVVAMYDFEAANHKELSFGEGEEIALLGLVDEEWMRVRIAWIRVRAGLGLMHMQCIS